MPHRPKRKPDKDGDVIPEDGEFRTELEKAGFVRPKKVKTND